MISLTCSLRLLVRDIKQPLASERERERAAAAVVVVHVVIYPSLSFIVKLSNLMLTRPVKSCGVLEMLTLDITMTFDHCIINGVL